MNDVSRFESKYVKSSNGCWEWTGATWDGYGEFWLAGTSRRAHRVSYRMYVGNIPNDMCVLHKCNNRRCVNPEHLYLGSKQDNAQDAIAAGTINTTYKVNFSRRAKLSNDDVVCIKKMLRDHIKQWLIAWIYQVKPGTISAINTKINWSHVKI